MKKNMGITKYLIILTLVFSIIGYANSLKAEQETAQPIKQEAIFTIKELTEVAELAKVVETKGLTVHQVVSGNISDNTKGLKLLITMEGKTDKLSIYDLGDPQQRGDDFVFQQGDRLLDVKNFNETHAIILTTAFPNNFPPVNLVYVDNQGETVELYISESGQDGSILFIPNT